MLLNKNRIETNNKIGLSLNKNRIETNNKIGLSLNENTIETNNKIGLSLNKEDSVSSYEPENENYDILIDNPCDKNMFICKECTEKFDCVFKMKKHLKTHDIINMILQ